MPNDALWMLDVSFEGAREEKFVLYTGRGKKEAMSGRRKQVNGSCRVRVKALRHFRRDWCQKWVGR